MKRTIKRWLINTPGFLALCRILTRNHVRTLMFHRFIGADNLGRRHHNSESLLRQMDYIAKYHNVISTLDHLNFLETGNRQKPCPVVFTIDDGYREFYEVVFPLFKERGWPAMFFATTGLVDGSTWFWWDKLTYLLDMAPDQKRIHRAGGEEILLDLTSKASRLKSWEAISDLLRWMTPGEVEFIIQDLSRFLSVPIPEEVPSEYCGITWGQAREMASCGIVFGGHTVTHPILARLSPEAAFQEIQLCREQLKEELGTAPVTFCYPQGGPADFSPEVRAMVSKAGFEACYVAFQDIRLEKNKMELPRYASPFDWDEFLWIISGAEYLHLRLLKILGRHFEPLESYWSGHSSRKQHN